MEDVSETGVKNSFKKQLLLIIAIAALYFAHSFSRTTVAANLLNLQNEYGVSKSQSGLILTFFFFSYGAGQIINAFFIKKYNKRFSIFIPVLLEAAAVFLIFIPMPFEIYKFIWLAGGIFYSFCWMSIMKILSENLEKKLLNKTSAVLSFMNGGGAAAAYLMSSLLTHFNVYRLVFLIGSLAVLLFDVFFFAISWKYKCSPKEYGDTEESVKTYEKLPRPKFLFIFFIAFLIYAPIASICLDGIKTWTPNILESGFGLNASLAIFFTIILPVIQCFCSLFVVLLRKFKIKYQVIIFSVMAVAILSFGMILFSLGYKILSIYLIFASLAYFGFVVINVIATNILPLEMRPYYDSGSFAGIVNGAAYIGSVIATYCIPLFVEATGWNALFILLIGLSALVLVSSLVLTLIFRKKDEYKPFM